MDKLAQTFQIRNLLLRQAMAECLGTLILVVRALRSFHLTDVLIYHIDVQVILTQAFLRRVDCMFYCDDSLPQEILVCAYSNLETKYYWINNNLCIDYCCYAKM